MIDNPRLSDAVASLLHKLEPSYLSKVKIPSDLQYHLTILKDALPLLLDPSRTHDLSLSTDDLEESVLRVNDLLDLHFDESSLIVKDDEEEEEKRFQELRLLISRLAPLFKSCFKIAEFELPENVEQLPPDLFRLVVYCSIYPKGHRFVRETLVNMWMAQDLLRDTHETSINPDKTPLVIQTYVKPDETTILRDTGKRYFEELLSRGIFEKAVSVFGNGNSRSVYSCEMNPLVCDAARRLAAEEVAVFSTRNSDGSSSVTVGQRTKHVALHKNGFSRFNLEKVIQNCENTTSLLMFSSHWDAFFGGSAGQIVRLDNLRQLRVLDLSGCQFKKLPPIHLSSLKYLSLFGNVLLESFSCEFFPLLETLDIHGCVRLENVVDLEFLRNLRNLYFTSRQSSLTLRFHRRRLLLELSHCVHLIDISDLHVNILRIFDCPSLKTLPFIGNLEELVLHNCAGPVLDYGTQLYGRNICLKRLELVGLPMVRLPRWLLSAQILEYFMIADCPQLQQLEDVQYLRSLQELYIYNCPNLRSLPYSALYSHRNLSLLDVRNYPNFTRRPTWFSNIQEKFSAIPSFFKKRISNGRAKTNKSSSQSSSESKGTRRNSLESASRPNVLKVYLDGQIYKFSPSQGHMCKRNGLDPRINTAYFQHKTNLLDVRASLFVVATLLATISFTAGFTLPGGFNQDTGEALLGKKASFLVFLIFDTLTLFFSMWVLICLTWSMVYDSSKSLILIDRSMVLLRIALNCTLLAFMTGVYIVIAPKTLWVAILIIVIISSLIGISVHKTFLYKVMDKLFPATYKECRDPLRLVELEPNASTASHLHQSDPYFVAKSRMNRTTGLLINHNHWRTLALVFKAIMRMKTIVSPGRELTKLHCCLFPDDYEFERETLVQLWMAVGFLGDIHMEDAGNLRFDALLEGQYILPARIDILTGKSKYKVNYDKVTKLLNGIQTLQKKDLRAMLEDEDASVVGWHVSIVSNHIDQGTFETLKTFNELRTLLFVRNYGSSLKQIPSDLFISLKSIQALDLSGSHITELPSSIGNVIHLRYLDLSYTLIESLPESIDQLHQLQTLRLEGCMQLYNLPDGMKELTSLSYFDFDVLGQLTCMPKGIGALTKLRTLSAFIVDSREGCSIKELENMNNLEGSFCISGLENVADHHEAQTATLSDKRYLTRLQLRWNDFKSYDDQKRRDISWTTYHLEPNSCLEELEILYYPGLKLPPWVGFPKFKELCSITLLKCSIEELHIKLGKLPNLRYLNITFMYILTGINYRVHRLFSGEHPCGFPKLETLQIDGMPKLATWDGVCYGDFPLLSKLSVKQCPKLSVLPFLPDLPSLKHLEISHCKVLNSLSTGPTLSTSLESLVIDACPLLKKRYIRGGEGWFEIEHIPDITIDLKDVRSTHEDGADDDTSSAGSNSDSDYSEGSDNNVHPYDSC